MSAAVSLVKVLLAHSYLILCNPMDCSPPGSSVHGILQERMLEWVPMPSSRRGLPDPGIKLGSPALQADSLPLSHQGSSCMCIYMSKYIRVHICYTDTHIHIYMNGNPAKTFGQISRRQDLDKQMVFLRREHWLGM